MKLKRKCRQAEPRDPLSRQELSGVVRGVHVSATVHVEACTCLLQCTERRRARVCYSARRGGVHVSATVHGEACTCLLQCTERRRARVCYSARRGVHVSATVHGEACTCLLQCTERRRARVSYSARRGGVHVSPTVHGEEACTCLLQCTERRRARRGGVHVSATVHGEEACTCLLQCTERRRARVCYSARGGHGEESACTCLPYSAGEEGQFCQRMSTEACTCYMHVEACQRRWLSGCLSRLRRRRGLYESRSRQALCKCSVSDANVCVEKEEHRTGSPAATRPPSQGDAVFFPKPRTPDLEVSTTDFGGNLVEGPVILLVTVIDQNDNRPIFRDTRYAGAVLEGSPTGTTVMTMTARDADDPLTDNAVLRYSIARQSPDKPSPNMFYIDPERGDIVTVISPSLLDRERVKKLFGGAALRTIDHNKNHHHHMFIPLSLYRCL
ncbi:hypothetical protein CRUP_001993 [Coryphaenoides rupestris]|nr:hypothetical protein CRUP_001993 [Coryphaenoides rupestris]